MDISVDSAKLIDVMYENDSMYDIDNKPMFCDDSNVSMCDVVADAAVHGVFNAPSDVNDLFYSAPPAWFAWEQLPQRGSSDFGSVKGNRVITDEWREDVNFWLGENQQHLDLADGIFGLNTTTLPHSSQGGLDIARATFDQAHQQTCNLCKEVPDITPFLGDIVATRDCIRGSGVPNAVGCRIPVYSNLNISAWRELTSGFQDSLVVDYLEFGWPIGIDVDASVNSKWVSNHTGARDYPEAIEDYLIQGVNKGHILGPFQVSPFDTGTAISPLNTVPKKDNASRRIILDLSAPRGCAVNESIPKDSFLGVPLRLHLPSVDNLVSLVKEQGVGCFMYKRDLKAAYRQLPVDPGDVSYLGYVVNNHIYFDRVYPMGLRSACQGCQRTTNAVVFAFSRSGFQLVNYIDDLAGVESADRAEEAFVALGALLHTLGLMESIEKACAPSTIMLFLGIQFDTVKCTLEVPQAKLKEIRVLLHKWLDKKSASKQEVQSLVGSLNFLAACIRPGRIFMSRLLNTLRSMSDSGLHSLDEAFLRDVKWWQFVAPGYNGVSLMPLNEWSKPDVTASCDACLRGCGGWSDGLFFHRAFPQFILQQELHINALELLTVMLTLKLWGSRWRGVRFKVFCDNLASVHVINSGKTRDPFLQACVREICFLCAVFDCEIRAVHLAGEDNRLADFLSRWDVAPGYRDKFFTEAAQFECTECSVTDEMFRFSHPW